MYNVQDNIKYNSCIFIFGIDQWIDVEYIAKNISEENKIIICEPDFFVYKKYCNDALKNVILLYIDKNNISYFKNIMMQNLNIYNYKNVIIGNSKNCNIKYKEIYDIFENMIMDYSYKLNVAVNTIDTFKQLNLRNSIYYLNSLNESVLLDEYKDINKNVPAIIVSAGPSLDKNIADMIKYKKKLKNFFIIAGNRTLEPLIKNNIIPDLLVTIDPGSVAEEMISHSQFYEVPLVYYEKSNWKIINSYKGPKISASELFLQNVCNMKNVRYTTVAGSVAHTCTDIAAFLGCNPIIFTGQDFAYTFDKNFAESAKYLNQNEIKQSQSLIYMTDVFNKKIKSSSLFKVYKENMEIIINKIKSKNNIEFINCSYGAQINGTYNEELKKILNKPVVKIKKTLKSRNYINIDKKLMFESFLVYIDSFIKICDKYIKEMERYEFSHKDVDEMLQTINDRISDSYGVWLKDYFEIFGVEYRKKYFNFTISEYKNFKNSIYDKNNAYFEILHLLKDTLLIVHKQFLPIINNI